LFTLKYFVGLCVTAMPIITAILTPAPKQRREKRDN
jgi:hypothetical protein